MLSTLSGSTRVIPIVGDPIAQVKSPAGVTAAFAARAMNAVCVPVHVGTEDFAAFMQLVRGWRNCDGVIVTVPHKFAAFEACDTTSERARFLGTVNAIRRGEDGGLHGDMFDGLGFVASCKEKGCDFKGRKALLVGAGGAGTAIAHAVVSEGAALLAIADLDAGRRDALVARLASAGFPVEARPADATGFEIVLNATPMGMSASDPHPVPAASLVSASLVSASRGSSAFVGDVVTAPDPSPLIAAARARGCRTSTGVDMFAKVRDLMVDFLLAGR